MPGFTIYMNLYNYTFHTKKKKWCMQCQEWGMWQRPVQPIFFALKRSRGLVFGGGHNNKVEEYIISASVGENNILACS